MQQALGSALTLIRIDTTQFAGLKTWDGGSVAAYTRLTLAEAVPDVAIADRERLGFSVTAPYFNSGVFLIDLDRWWHEEVGTQTLAWAEANPERLS